MFRICVICTGNRCRSPFAEAILRQASVGLPIEVTSVGLLDIGPAGVPPELLEVAANMDVDLKGHRARAISTVVPTDFDLFLGMDRDHVSSAVIDRGAPPDKTFTVMEAVRLLKQIDIPAEDDPVERARLLLKRAHEHRHAHPSFVSGEGIPDPLGGPKKGYVAMAAQLRDLCLELVALLFRPLR